MKLFTANMKMADVVHGNYLLMPVISRFGIKLGFAEKTVEAVCKNYKINVEFFLAIINAFSNEQYILERKRSTLNVLMIVDYLQKTHNYYIKKQVPLIEKLLSNLMRQEPSDSKNLKLIRKFFLDYKSELLNHLSREETTTFPYVKKVYHLFHTPHPSQREKRILSKYSMHVFEEEHSEIDEKLYDLKNILIKYFHGDSMESQYQEAVFELFRLEKDIKDHTRIENNILLPLVAEMEDTLFYPKEHTKFTAGKKALADSGVQTVRQNTAAPENQIRAEHQSNLNLLKLRTKKIEDLTTREAEVLQLVACGYLNKQIADKLSISLHTVISHRKNLTRKLQIKTVAGLTIYALLNNLITSRDISIK